MDTKNILGEAIGTFIMVLFGCGAVAVQVLFNTHQGLFQIGIIWGIGVTLAIYITRHISSAHLNLAVSVAMVSSKRMKLEKLPSYLFGQLLGAFLAGLLVYLVFFPSILAFENTHNIIRGTIESTETGKMFGEYYNTISSTSVVPMWLAMVVEGIGTFLLVFIIFSLTEGCNIGRPEDSLTPIFIGLTVTSIICLFAPLTQAGLNPARDFAPRMVAYIFGWGQAAFPDDKFGFFFVYILSPILGGQVAGLFFVKVVEPTFTSINDSCN